MSPFSEWQRVYTSAYLASQLFDWRGIELCNYELAMVQTSVLGKNDTRLQKPFAAPLTSKEGVSRFRNRI
ncbi:hypothetical protein COCOBI_pt-1100 (chloroplast) [Coccomyxa sp. Obi]|nr:hypothetical protein COCOBI_pt-1100 [Coccomyxa sp. Obi]